MFTCGGLHACYVRWIRTSVSIVDYARLFACWTACVHDGLIA